MPRFAPATRASFQVLEYLNKKGYTRTESTLRKESAVYSDKTKPPPKRVDEMGSEKFEKAYGMLEERRRCETGAYYLDVWAIRNTNSLAI